MLENYRRFCAVIGTDPERAVLSKQIHALDINALTSLSETFPYALTEGARFHLATVSSAVGGIPYLIDQDVNGYLFAPGDWETLGSQLAALALDDKLRRDMLRNQTNFRSPKKNENMVDSAGAMSYT